MLSFSSHIKKAHTSALHAFGFINRISRELNSRRLVLRMVNIYVTPIIEYASIVWSKRESTLERTLEDILHRATRTQLNSPYRTDAPGYICFPERCQILNVLTYNARRLIAAVVFAMGIYQGRIVSQLRERMIYYRVTNRSTRAPLLFNTSLRSICQSSPLYKLMVLLNEFRTVISLEDSPDVTKKKLKAHFTDFFT